MTPEPLVLFEHRTPGLRRRELQAFARALRDEVALGRPFCCLITTDAGLQRMNRDFLGKDYPTDVLSFPSGEPQGPLGDIAISWHRAAAQAAAYGHDTPTELRILLLHGLLHLLGYDHESDRGRMRRAESRWRAHFQLPASLIERARR
ncbi:MAG: rRNA maturation RNase YbeY [Acidobacteria bacterium]|nr:rRNA maturation RNase YbeY [Acidobacteriota bacterium]